MDNSLFHAVCSHKQASSPRAWPPLDSFGTSDRGNNSLGINRRQERRPVPESIYLRNVTRLKCSSRMDVANLALQPSSAVLQVAGDLPIR